MPNYPKWLKTPWYFINEYKIMVMLLLIDLKMKNNNNQRN